MSQPAPSSIGAQVIAAAVALLGTLGDAPVYRSRMTAFSLDQLPARNVMPEDGEPTYSTSGTTDHILRFVVRHTAQAKDEVDAAVDPLYVATSRALLADLTLGGLVTSLREGKQRWEMERGEVAVVALVVTYEVEFSTARADPSVQRF